eukprot:760168-Hanusia_phi.AAC.1
MLYLLQPEERHCPASPTDAGWDQLTPAGPQAWDRALIQRQADDHCQIIIRGDRVPAGENPGRYSVPTSNEEVGAVITGNLNQLGNRDIAVQLKDGSTKFVPLLNCAYDTGLQYPLLFPHAAKMAFISGSLQIQPVPDGRR